jgi:hypothetical protein
MESTCYLCKKKMGLKRYKRMLNALQGDKVVEVCSKKCQSRKLRQWGNNDKMKGR